MKNKRLIITTIISFLLVNTTYYWEGKLGLFAFPTFLVLAAVYVGLVITFVRQVYVAIKQKFTEKSRIFVVGLLTIVLVLAFYKPFGLVDFDRLEGDDVHVAEREGSANCMTILKFKDDLTFRERNVCFGVTETKGAFHLKSDTIFFDNVSLGRHEDEFYKFAVVKPSQYYKGGKHFDSAIYKSLTDTIGHKLLITKNELNKLENKKPNR